jgi:hypothetical protein
MNAQNRYSRTAILSTAAALFLLMTGLAFFVRDASTSRRSANSQHTLVVSAVDLFYNSRGNLLTSVVEVRYDGSPVAGAVVYSTMSKSNPPGPTRNLNGRTDRRGRFMMSVPAAGPGYYLYSVAHVAYAGVTLDRQGSVSLEAGEQVGPDTDNAPPTATAVPPTATNVPPTATSSPTATGTVPTATSIPSTATSVPPTATNVPPTATHDHGGEVSTSWHAPTTHEHGDAPPQWVTDWSMEQFGHGVIYGGDEQTPNENAIKHNAFKGFTTTMDGVELYFRVHAQSNPHGRMAQFHSYEIYARDPSGNISFWQGWTDCGSPDTNRFPRSQGDPGIRPGMLVVDQAAWDAGIRFEQWYCMGSAWSWDLGWTIGETTTIWRPGEHLNDPMNRANWTTTGSYGLTRRIEAAWYGPDSQYAPNRGNPPKDQWFCATLQGQITSVGVNPNSCPSGQVPQYIASTMVSVEFPGNAVQKGFPGSGSLALPN